MDAATDAAASNGGDPQPCVLGRIDLVDIEPTTSDRDAAHQQQRDAGVVYAQAYLHPSLRLRAVPVDQAPDHATVPAHYLRRFETNATGHGDNDDDESSTQPTACSLPLRPFTRKESPEGHFVPGDKEWRHHKYYMDIVFASLGWISFTHRQKFLLKPYCVKGSVFSKRPALYPVNLHDRLDEDPVDDPGAEWTDEERRKRLRDAAHEGRHQSNRPRRHRSSGSTLRRGASHGSPAEDIFDEEDDEFY